MRKEVQELKIYLESLTNREYGDYINRLELRDNDAIRVVTLENQRRHAIESLRRF